MAHTNTTLTSWAMNWAEQGRVPDAIVRLGIRQLLKQRLAELGGDGTRTVESALQEFIARMNDAEVAPVPHKANQQHYEVPAEFFTRVLGRHLKYSSCYWQDDVTELDQAEADALALTCDHATLMDGQDVLELGCGWGSLTLWMAQHFPNSRITAVSNSSSQRRFIVQRCTELDLNNVNVITADMNEFSIDRQFDRVVSVEMFEHMRNYRELMRRVQTWLRPGGRLLIHIFCHRSRPYEFIDEGPGDWMSRHFFSGGIMPSDELPHRFQDHLRLIDKWRWEGTHYQKTANAWLASMDREREEIDPVLANCYGTGEVTRWRARWRIFFMACAELFGYRQGKEWWVSHYLFENPAR